MNLSDCIVNVKRCFLPLFISVPKQPFRERFITLAGIERLISTGHAERVFEGGGGGGGGERETTR